MQKAGEKLMQKGKSIKKSFLACDSRACQLVKQGINMDTRPE